MGNTQPKPKPLYEDTYETLNQKDADEIKKFYKVVEVSWVSQGDVDKAMLGDRYFDFHPEKTEVVEFCEAHIDTKYNKSVDYICSKKEQLCICNTLADYSRAHHAFMGRPPVVSWVGEKKEKVPFWKEE